MKATAAIAAIRAAKANGDAGAWTVRVKRGAYFFAEPLVFTPADSGTPEAPVRWLGDPGETAFVGGERVKGWRDEGNGVVRGKPDTGRFPTVIEGFAENGKLRLVVHDVFSNRVVLDKYL